MSVAFLTPEVTSSREVHARSPMERLAVAAGARLSQIEGWSVANAFSEPSVEWERLTRTVGFADRSSLGKLEIQGEPEALARIAAQLGIAPEPGLASGRPGDWWCPVTPGRVLVLCEASAAGATRAAVARAAEDSGGSTGVVDVTCGLAALALVGPQARELLARFCAIDVRPALVPVRAFRPGSIARTPGYLLVEGADSLLVLVGWALGAYLWELVADAAAALGGGPVGAEALGHHLESGDA
jgi:heterotetrameric sarcosine oxidase gamma subunit